jgi:hypothetical protein
MKYLSALSVTIFGLCSWTTAFGQITDAEVPGDHFSLEGALELFKKSESPEEFENLLNSPDSKVNNLDLNGDGYTDYIRVIDRQDRNVHVFILQAIVSDSESQDVAVIELEKLANGKAVLQIIGDEDIYGVETIIEPTREVRTYAGTMTTTSVVNVWTWPVVYHVYSPYYVVWNSPWGWYHRPARWNPWRPVVFVHYYEYWRPYRTYYSGYHSHRCSSAQNIYYPHRSKSVIVRDRHYVQLDRYRSTHRGNGRTTTGESQRNTNSGGRTGHEEHGRMANFEKSRSQYQDIANTGSDEVNEQPTRSVKMTSRNDFQDNKSHDTRVIKAGTQYNNRDLKKATAFDRNTSTHSNFQNQNNSSIHQNSFRKESFNSATRNARNTGSQNLAPSQTERRANTTQRTTSEHRSAIKSYVPSGISTKQQRSSFSGEAMRKLKH